MINKCSTAQHFFLYLIQVTCINDVTFIDVKLYCPLHVHAFQQIPIVINVIFEMLNGFYFSKPTISNNFGNNDNTWKSEWRLLDSHVGHCLRGDDVKANIVKCNCHFHKMKLVSFTLLTTTYTYYNLCHLQLAFKQVPRWFGRC